MTFDTRALLETMTHQPGVYRMFDAQGHLLYVGKANDLKKRLLTHFQGSAASPKWKQLLTQIAHVDVTVTRGEAEALLLEQNYVRAHRPKYNVLLQDDKSFPQLLLCAGSYPSLRFHRGPKKRKGEYFGPLASSSAAKALLKLLKPLFRVRQCHEAMFNHRSKPCLQYDLGNCMAPCVSGHVTDEAYQAQVEALRRFLHGQTQEVLDALVAQMNRASAACRYEEAIALRDDIRALNTLTTSQSVQAGSLLSADVLSASLGPDEACVNQLLIRNGQLLSSHNHFLKTPLVCGEDELLSEFIGQFYLSAGDSVPLLPKQLILGVSLPQVESLQSLLGVGVALLQGENFRGEMRQLLELSSLNAQSGLQSRQAGRHRLEDRFEQLSSWLGETIEVIECVDISHTGGRCTVGSCVAFGKTGSIRSRFRTYRLEGLTPGDDYAAIYQTVFRHYKDRLPAEWPQLLLVDGGSGQLQQAEKALEAAGISLRAIAIAKGEGRRPGREKIFLSSKEQERFPETSAVLHLLQQVRDEAHRTAIGRHRKRRSAQLTESRLDRVSGIGPARRQKLLTHFAGLKGLKGASIEDIAAVPGISKRLASEIFSLFHPS